MEKQIGGYETKIFLSEVNPDFICQIFSDIQIKEMGKDFFRVKEERWKCFSGNYWRIPGKDIPTGKETSPDNR